jgi:hypothetical protein
MVFHAIECKFINQYSTVELYRITSIPETGWFRIWFGGDDVILIQGVIH